MKTTITTEEILKELFKSGKSKAKFKKVIFKDGHFVQKINKKKVAED